MSDIRLDVSFPAEWGYLGTDGLDGPPTDGGAIYVGRMDYDPDAGDSGEAEAILKTSLDEVIGELIANTGGDQLCPAENAYDMRRIRDALRAAANRLDEFLGPLK